MQWFFNGLIKAIIDYLASFFKKEAEAKARVERQKQKDSTSYEAYKKALESGDKDAIEKALEDLLNGK